MGRFLSGSDGNAKLLAVRFRNAPPKLSSQVQFLCESILHEGQWKRYDNRHEIRLDKRSDNMGGDQLHVRRTDGEEWAYRHNGLKSEPSKYTSPATNTVRDIVAKQFGIKDQSIIESIEIVSADAQLIMFEVSFS
jgi:hypothetical protein